MPFSFLLRAYYFFFWSWGYWLQEKAARLPPVEEIRTLLDRSVRGVLSTVSQVCGNSSVNSCIWFALLSYLVLTFGYCYNSTALVDIHANTDRGRERFQRNYVIEIGSLQQENNSARSLKRNIWLFMNVGDIEFFYYCSFPIDFIPLLVKRKVCESSGNCVEPYGTTLSLDFWSAETWWLSIRVNGWLCIGCRWGSNISS